jgi:hypothetical protein
MSSAFENAMADRQAENYTQTYPVTPYWMRATVHIPPCSHCGASGFDITQEELDDAGGGIACENCDYMIEPVSISAAPAAGEQR